MKKVLLAILLIWGLLVISPVETYAAESVFQVDVGSFDIWRNSAGDWIASEPPRYNEAYQPGDTVQILPYQIQGPSNATGIKSVRMATDIEAWRLGGRAEEYVEYDMFFSKALLKIEYTYIPETKSAQVQYICTLETAPQGIEKTTTGRNITRDWQNEIVEGYRYYMPLLVEWETGGIDLQIEADETEVYKAYAGEPVHVQVSQYSSENILLDKNRIRKETIEAEISWTGPTGEGEQSISIEPYGFSTNIVEFTGYAGNTYYVTGEIMPTVETDIDLTNNKCTTKIVIVEMYRNTEYKPPVNEEEKKGKDIQVNIIG